MFKSAAYFPTLTTLGLYLPTLNTNKQSRKQRERERGGRERDLNETLGVKYSSIHPDLTALYLQVPSIDGAKAMINAIFTVFSKKLNFQKVKKFGDPYSAKELEV